MQRAQRTSLRSGHMSTARKRRLRPVVCFPVVHLKVPEKRGAALSAFLDAKSIDPHPSDHPFVSFLRKSVCLYVDVKIPCWHHFIRPNQLPQPYACDESEECVSTVQQHSKTFVLSIEYTQVSSHNFTSKAWGSASSLMVPRRSEFHESAPENRFPDFSIAHERAQTTRQARPPCYRKGPTKTPEDTLEVSGKRHCVQICPSRKMQGREARTIFRRGLFVWPDTLAKNGRVSA